MNSNNDFQAILKDLGKQARKTAEKQVAKQQAVQSEQNKQIDFSAIMADVKPLKSGRGRYLQPRDLSPIKQRPINGRRLLLYRGRAMARHPLFIQQKRTRSKRHQTPAKRLLPRCCRCRPARLHTRRSPASIERIYCFRPTAGGVRGNYPWQRIGFLRISAKVEKPGPTLADDASRRFGLRRTA